MKFFFAQERIINTGSITSVDTRRGIVWTVDGNTISLSNEDLRNLVATLKEIHRQSCEKE